MISSKEELDDALHELCGLMSSKNHSAHQKHRMESLVDAVETYEGTHYPIEDPSDAALLQHLLAAKGVSAQKLSRESKVPLRNVRSILKGATTIAPKEATAFAKFFSVEPSVFKADDEVSPTGFFVASRPAGLRVHAYFRLGGSSSSSWTTAAKSIQSGVMACGYVAPRQLDRSQARPVALRS